MPEWQPSGKLMSVLLHQLLVTWGPSLPRGEPQFPCLDNEEALRTLPTGAL